MRLLLCSAAILFAACAHSPDKPASAEYLKKSANTFHQRLRWGDYRGAAEMVVPERRAPFLAAREATHDERDLKITEYELEDAEVAPSGREATVVSRLWWMRLPSVTVEERVIRTWFEWRDNTWYVAAMERGPFGDELRPDQASSAP